MMEDELQKMLVAVGSLAEVLGLFRNELEKQGFDDEDIATLCNTLLIELLGR